ncbi:SemiSWEET family sugar transporter [Chitinimonas taiwanensis]|uniref:MtN3 and saliva related transmembrane protein n=1 Tax=Chitinimonas taiwanensis DSM 18899 TaxID=1121279 RepID=A0A1K2HQ41_9NEIS|nr:SemiSWEET transporter [Chitinimonas taiwanensis]SFZ78932.1 MtN3 and saliva related transmembrane protein [Chitinimonas taiwanensis DSM 18899]
MSDSATLVGMLAGFCTTAAFLPQVIRVWRTRRADDISLGMYLLFVSGTILWLVYGLMIGSLPVVLYNIITSLLAGAVLLLKLYFERQRRQAVQKNH